MRAVRALLATLLVAVTGASGAARRAGRPRPRSRSRWARISLDADHPRPAVAGRAGPEVTISGRITNISDIELSNLQVAFWRYSTPSRPAEGMDHALDLGGERPARAPRAQDGSLYVYVPPSPTAPWTRTSRRRSPISATLAQLELPDIDGVYLVGVHLRGRVDGAGPDVTVGRGRTFLPVVSKAPKQTVRQTSIVVLTSRPSLLRTGLLPDDHLVEELSSSGPADPAAGGGRCPGHELRGRPGPGPGGPDHGRRPPGMNADGTTREGGGAAAAQTWLTELTELIRSGDGYRLLYGDPDVAALVHNDGTTQLTDAASDRRPGPGHGEPAVADPARDGTADEETVQAAAGAGPGGHPALRRHHPDDGRLPRPARVRTAATLVRYTAGASGGGGPGPAPAQHRRPRCSSGCCPTPGSPPRSAPDGSPSRSGPADHRPRPDGGHGQRGRRRPGWPPRTLTQLLDSHAVGLEPASSATPRSARSAELTRGQLDQPRPARRAVRTPTPICWSSRRPPGRRRRSPWPARA